MMMSRNWGGNGNVGMWECVMRLLWLGSCVRSCHVAAVHVRLSCTLCWHGARQAASARVEGA